MGETGSDEQNSRRLRFRRSQRLTRAHEFQQVRQHGETAHGALMVFSWWHSPSGELARTGIITSRRVGNAVDRNRVRRQLREVVRLHQHALRRGTWMVLIARAKAADASLREIEAEWLRLATRANIVRSPAASA